MLLELNNLKQRTLRFLSTIQISKQSLTNLLTGTAGIYFCYLLSGIINQRIIKIPYVQSNQQGFQFQQHYQSSLGFVFFVSFIPWIISSYVVKNNIQESKRVNIPDKKAALCALVCLISMYCYNNSIYYLSFPVAALFKSCNILSVIIVGIFFSRLKDGSEHKLKSDTLISGCLVALGLILFKIFEPSTNFISNNSNSQLVGICSLAISWICDGFLPDLQAQIKVKLKPTPLEMLVAINKWVSLISLALMLVTGQIGYMCYFIIKHKQFLFHIILMGLLATFGQMFVYRMIKQFKQHIVPFVLTTRKIMTALVSLIVYKHSTNIGQIFGILIVLGVVTYEFLQAISVLEKKNPNKLAYKNEEMTQLIQSQKSEQLVIELSSISPSYSNGIFDEEKRHRDRQLINNKNNQFTHQDYRAMMYSQEYKRKYSQIKREVPYQIRKEVPYQSNFKKKGKENPNVIDLQRSEYSMISHQQTKQIKNENENLI